ncbi:MAG TPA: HigA family addiction module antitoxin [Methylomirabilota bacterium]|nr:HigA family addiction module antitoxin [Methylomirabilota bacterium]
MSNRTPAEVFPPGEFILDELDERGWSQTSLAKITGRPDSTISSIISGKKSITPEIASEFASAFGTSPQFWLNLENAYQLSKLAVEDGAIKHRAKLFETAPIRDMEKRGWIRILDSVEETEKELVNFYSIPTLEQLPQLRLAARATDQNKSELTPEQLAWCVRALQLAKSVPAKKYTNKSFDDGVSQLRLLADFPENARKVSRVLSEMGIRFVVVEHLPKSKIDGAALWLGDDWSKPVIALSLRYDRIDSFWHTLFHELSHIKNKDSYIVDVDMVGADRCLSDEALSEIETRANREAAEMLIPKQTMDSFISRTHPFYYTEKIIQFANLIKIHPGIIAGQLQHRKKIDWTANRQMLVKVRDILISGAMTDGWGTAGK